MFVEFLMCRQLRLGARAAKFEGLALPNNKMDALVDAVHGLIEREVAYVVDVPGVGTFVCLDYEEMKKRMPFHLFAIETMNPLPVWYPCLDKHTRTKHMDYALWAPYVEGGVSPWGKGIPTANLEHMLHVL